MVTINRMKKLLLELLKNSHRSDRQLAREMGTSQPTVTRMRNKLEKNGWIKEYTSAKLRKNGHSINGDHYFQDSLEKGVCGKREKSVNDPPKRYFLG